MGELRVADVPGQELAVIGLGSCIALALTDPHAQVAGLAHIVLPARPGGDEPVSQPGRYADTAVPALLDAVVGAGARRRRLRAVVIGGARMFATGLDIGNRNAEAVTAGLNRTGIQIHASDLGGSRGRTVRVDVAGAISSQTTGRAPKLLYGPDHRALAA